MAASGYAKRNFEEYEQPQYTTTRRYDAQPVAKDESSTTGKN
jgi:hypothetical protein